MIRYDLENSSWLEQQGKARLIRLHYESQQNLALILEVLTKKCWECS